MACRINAFGQIVCTRFDSSSVDQQRLNGLVRLFTGQGVSHEKAILAAELVLAVFESSLPDSEIADRTNDTVSTVQLCLDPEEGFPEAIFKDENTALAYGSLKLAADKNWTGVCAMLQGLNKC